VLFILAPEIIPYKIIAHCVLLVWKISGEIFYVITQCKQCFISCVINQLMQECVEILCYVSHSWFFFNIYRDLTKLEDGIGDKVVQCIHFMASFVGCIILAFVKGWLLALVCLSSLPITLIAVGIVSVVQYPLHWLVTVNAKYLYILRVMYTILLTYLFINVYNFLVHNH